MRLASKPLAAVSFAVLAISSSDLAQAATPAQDRELTRYAYADGECSKNYFEIGNEILRAASADGAVSQWSIDQYRIRLDHSSGNPRIASEIYAFSTRRAYGAIELVRTSQVDNSNTFIAKWYEARTRFSASQLQQMRRTAPSKHQTVWLCE